MIMATSDYLSILENILKENELENEDLIEEFLHDAYNDDDKKEAISRFFSNNESSKNPFKSGYGYYDLLKTYEDILDEKDD